MTVYNESDITELESFYETIIKSFSTEKRVFEKSL